MSRRAPHGLNESTQTCTLSQPFRYNPVTHVSLRPHSIFLVCLTLILVVLYNVAFSSLRPLFSVSDHDNGMHSYYSRVHLADPMPIIIGIRLPTHLWPRNFLSVVLIV